MILEDKQKRDKEREKELSEEKSFTADKRGDSRIVSTKEKLDRRSDKKSVEAAPLLGDSIFLRYLPVPFIKYLYENDEQSFMEIYRRHDYRHPILIWNASMRSTLENKIKENAKTFLSMLGAFAREHRDPKLIPVCQRGVNEIVKYEQIENEVRCGRYYLGVWTSLKTDFTIAEEQEPEF